MNSLVGSLLPPSERPFGKYELIVKLATGGMAEIYLASEMVRGQRKLSVIKRVLPHLQEDTRFLAMFRDEARLASALEHPNVCRVHDWGMVKDVYFMAMEYLHGVPLSRMLLRASRTGQPLPLEIVLAIVMQSAEGLHYAHTLCDEHGQRLDVVHRDVSPPNIFVGADGRVKLLDFGVAKARGFAKTTRTGTVKGKNSYMSPEQILGEPVDHRCDIFSLGICMWESLTSERLFQRDTEFKTFTAVTESDAPNPRTKRSNLPAALAQIVMKSLARDRNQRFGSAEALARALRSLEIHPASEQELGAFVALHFSVELRSKQLLIDTIHETMGKTEAEAQEIRARRKRATTLVVPPVRRVSPKRSATRATPYVLAAGLTALIGAALWALSVVL